MSGRTLRKVGALLLGYPDRNRFGLVLSALDDVEDPGARDLLRRFLEESLALPDAEREGRYVATFDFREDLSLYLTFQELGDARDRAPQLLALKREMRHCGFLCPKDELPDYIPLLLEFLAECPDGYDDRPLSYRLARALAGIAERLGEDHPYLPLLRAILTALPSDAAAQEKPMGEAEDLELPYPLRYL
jgi:nitrate reductase delta subunit